MLRRRAILCVGLALVLLTASARAGEAPPPFIDPVEVAGLLLSSDDAERERGVVLLLERLAQGGDVGPFLRAMASAQALVAQGAVPRQGLDRQSLLERTRAYRLRLEETKARLEAEEIDAAAARPQGVEQATTDEAEVVDELLVAGASASGRPAPPTSARSAPDETDGALSVTVARGDVSVLRVSRAEYDAWRGGPSESDATKVRNKIKARTVPEPSATAEGPTVDAATLGGQEALAFLDTARLLPGATLTQKHTSLGPDPSPLLRVETVAYRRGIRRTKGGAYALQSGEIPKGLRVLASAVEGQDGLVQLRIQVRHTDVPQPLPVTRIQPAADVEAIEVDSPEWRTASAELSREAAPGEMAAFVFPDLVPNEVVLIGVHLDP